MKHTTVINAGDVVLCDLCNADYTNDYDTLGGFLFGSKAVCPKCAPDFYESVKKYNEECYITARARSSQPFSEFVRQIRGGPGVITVTSFDTMDELLNEVYPVEPEQPEPTKESEDMSNKTDETDYVVKTFEVQISKTETNCYVGYIEVEAKSEEEAEHLITEKYMNDIDWELDDCDTEYSFDTFDEVEVEEEEAEEEEGNESSDEQTT